MRRALQVVWFSIRAIYDELFILAGIGGLWLVMSLFVPAGILWLTRFLPPSMMTTLLNLGSFVLVPPCTAAVYQVAMKVAEEKQIEFGHFWQGFRAHWKTSYKVTVIVAISGIIIVLSVLFYFNNSQNIVFLVAGILVLWGLALWLCVQIYLWPLIISQKGQRIVMIVKNASLLTLAFPVFTLVITVLIVFVTILSVGLPILLVLWMPFVSVLSCRAFKSSLQQVDIVKLEWRKGDTRSE